MHGQIDSNKNEQYITSLSVGGVDSWLSASGFGCWRGRCAGWHWSLLRRCSFSVGASLAVPEQEPSRALREGVLETAGLCVGEKGQGAWTWWRTRAASLSSTWLDDGHPSLVCNDCK